MKRPGAYAAAACSHGSHGACRARLIVSLLALASTTAWRVEAAPTAAQLQRSLSPAAAEVDELWAQYLSVLAVARLEGQTSLADALAPFSSGSYAFSLTPHQLQRAFVNQVKGTRLRKLVRTQLLAPSPRPLKIGVIGTSVSWGTGPSQRGTTDYASMLPLALQLAFPKATNITVRNGCSPGTGSGFANMCYSSMLDEDVDLVVAEFVTNDFIADIIWNNEHVRTMERLIRKVLRMRNKPAVLLVQVPTWGQMFNTTREGHKLFHQSAEVVYSPLSQYYALPALSFRNAWWHDAERSTRLAPRGWASVTASCQVHPNDLGHRSLLDMVMWLMLQTVVDLHLNPMSRREVLALYQPLPAPLHPGNYEEEVSMCLVEDKLQQIVNGAQSEGWQLINEGTEIKKKFGFVSTTPGSQLSFTLDVALVLGVKDINTLPANQRDVNVLLAYLQSYSGMGQAVWTCLHGCVCSPKVLDAHHVQQTSTTFLALMATRATGQQCTMGVRLLNTTASTTAAGRPGHKFKVNSVMMSRRDTMGFHWDEDKSNEFWLVEVLQNRFEQAR